MKKYRYKHYLPEDFINKYIDYLEEKENKSPYYDIDAVSTKCYNYYKDLSEFLADVVNSKFQCPQKNSYPFAMELDGKFFTSDTFGFSAFKHDQEFNSNYPYARFLKLDGDSKVDIDEKRKLVADCIYETRTIGGAFVWPKVYLKEHRNPGYYSLYNYYRGALGYIEDRVDLTLYEIKCFFDIYNEKKEYNEFICAYRKKYDKNIMFNYTNKPGISEFTPEEKTLEMKYVFNWLSTFSSFKDYVNKLCFNPFISDLNGDYLIINIANKDKEVLPIDEYNLLDRNELKHIREMDVQELRTLIINLKNITVERTELISESLFKSINKYTFYNNLKIQSIEFDKSQFDLADFNHSMGLIIR